MQSIPLPTRNEPKATYAVQLDGKSFDLTFVWNSKTDNWTLNVATSSGTHLSDGILLAPGINLLRNLAADDRPGGALVLTNFENKIPTYSSIETSELFYVEVAELEG